jgi:hypothetical protein
MKNNLGNKLVLIFVFIASLYADDDFSYNINVPYKISINKKEPLYLECEIKQLKYDDKIIFFKLTPKQNSAFEIHFLKLKEINKLHNKKLVYSYLIYPLKKGDYKLEFKLFLQKTNEEGLKPEYEGDRDNVLSMVSKDSYANIKPILVNVKSVNKNNILFGDFNLTYKINQKTYEAYEPIYITYTLSGEGYNPNIKDLFQKSKNYEYFLDTPKKIIKYTKNGTKIKYIYKYAFISNKSFTIPSVVLDYVKTPSIDIKIIKPNKNQLLDKKIYPISSKEIYQNYINYLWYFGIFISGFVSANMLNHFRLRKKRYKNNVPKLKKPEDIKDLKQRLIWMISEDKKLYKKEIDELSKKLFS